MTLTIRGIPEDQLSRLVDALIVVESGGDDNAIGDGGKAYGCLQIHQGVLDDYNAPYLDDEQPVGLRDLLGNRELSRGVCYWYLHHWAEHAWLAHGVPASLEMLARIWNGGPHGYGKAATLPYWAKVKAELERQK